MLETHEQLVRATAGDPYARWGVDPALPLRAFHRDGAVAWTVPREHYEAAPWLNALGPPAAVAALVTELLTDVGAQPGGTGLLDVPRGLTVPTGTLDLLPAPLRPVGAGDWSWWWIAAPPPPWPGEELVVDLDVTGPGPDRDDLAALLQEANPIASAPADDPGVTSWVGLRSPEGRLQACAANRPYVPSIPHLASIATRPGARRRGYGAAVTVVLTRRGLADGAAAVTLGMYADNEVGRTLYGRLGFNEAHRFTSGSFHATGGPAG